MKNKHAKVFCKLEMLRTVTNAMRKSCERVHQLTMMEYNPSKFEQNLLGVGAFAGATAGLFGGAHIYLSDVEPEERVSLATFGKSMLISSATSVAGGMLGMGVVGYGICFVYSLPILIPASGLATVVSIVCGSKPKPATHASA